MDVKLPELVAEELIVELIVELSVLEADEVLIGTVEED